MDIPENSHFNDCYFTSPLEGDAESRYVFIDGSGVLDSAKKRSTLTVGETGFGTALNFIVLLKNLMQEVPGTTLTYYTVDAYPLSSKECIEILRAFYSNIQDVGSVFFPLWDRLFGSLTGGMNTLNFTCGSITVRFYFFFGDVAAFLDRPFCVDAWFLDGHSPDKNPAMWHPDILHRIGKKSRPGTIFATYTAAGAVKRGLRDAGFRVRRKKGFGTKHHMIYGSKESVCEET
jgi:tRNA 5-methylaminomethyl-2-thiouridine biosynthesis bifunctional protein